MINQTILFLPQTDCCHTKIKPYARELGINVNWNPDLNLGKPLNKIFNHVIRFEVGEAYAKYGVIQANKRILEVVKEQSPKYVIWPTMTYEILEETFQEIRKLGAYVIGWFFDDEPRFEGYSRWWIPYMDYIFTADKASVSHYQQLGAKAFHLLVTGEPEDFIPSPTELSYNVSFVGSKYVADRANLVKHFLDDGISISTFGRGWSNGYVSHEEMVQIFYSSKINICFTKSYSGDRNQIKGKIFDITMCGGFLLCEYADGIEEFFEIGKEIVCFRNYSEALEKINYFLVNHKEREMIAQAGKLRSTRDLSQSKLLENIFSKIEIDTSVKKTCAVISSPDFKEMPRNIKQAHAQYHLQWAKVLKKEGFDNRFWQDEYNLACKYDRIFSLVDFKQRKISRVIALIGRLRQKFRIRSRLSELLKGKKISSKGELSTDSDFLLGRFTQHSIPMLLQFDFDKLKKMTLGFVEKMNLSFSMFEYKYSASCNKSNIYSSAYAVMIRSMYGELDKLPKDQKKKWSDYFNAFQNSTNGLFYDDVLSNEIYDDTDWWGARHLALHMITVYTALGEKPKYQFRFLEKYYNVSFLREWLSSQNWNTKSIYATDIDNNIMNIGVLLQYQRDFWSDAKAGESIKFIQDYLTEKINPNTGMWGYPNIDNNDELSRMAQFAYHLFQLFFYDSIDLGHKEKIIDSILKTQNIYGGFGVKLNSSACEDIDSIDILIRLTKQTDYKKNEIDLALKKAFVWVLVNQNEDGGFVFRRNEPFVYGHQEMSSIKNESAMFPTWFRTLILAYIERYLNLDTHFYIVNCPGYQF